MIKNYYPSKAKLEAFVIKQIPYNKVIGSPTDHVIPTEREISRALVLGLTVQEYRGRCKLVADANMMHSYALGDTVYSSIPKEREKYGPMIVVGICRHYDQYGSIDWNDPPYILCVSPLKDRSTTVNCTVGWVTKKEEVANVC